MAQIIIDGIPIDVQRKRIKNMYLRVLAPAGNVLLTAPMRVSDAKVAQFARTRIDWVKRAREKCLAAAPSQFESGDTLLLSGESVPLCVVPCAGRARAVYADGRVLLYAPPGADAAARKTAVDALYRAQLLSDAPPLIESWARTMGVHPGALTIRDMSTRYGTCNTANGRITLNLRLSKAAPVYLAYVVVHELAHLIEPNHSARFYAVMDSYLPAWKTLRRELKSLPL